MSRSDEYYYQCPRCKRWVSAAKRRCDCGQFLDHLTPVLKPEGEADKPTQESGTDKTVKEKEADKSMQENGAVCAGDYPLMRCSRCGKKHRTCARECPDCGGILQIELEDQRRENDSNSRDGDLEEDYLEGLTLPVEYEEEESGTEEERPLFYFNVCRYDNGAAIAANTGNIPVYTEGSQKLLIGRNLFVRDGRLFFSAGSKELDDRYRTISRNNALLFVEEGRLYIELYREDGAGKAPVYVNGERLGKDEIRELHHGDRLRFGGKKTVHDGTIDMEIVSAKEKDRQRTDGEDKSTDSMVREMYKGFIQLQGDVKSIQQIVSQINPADLTMRRGEDAEAYESRLSASMPEAEYPTREECVHRFLAAVLAEDTEGYREKMAFFKENDRRFHLLYQAAFFESACAANGLEDYAGPMSFLGKAVEGFVMGEIADVVKAFNGEAYSSLAVQKGSWINQSDILGLCRQNGAINRILLAAGYSGKEKQEMYGRVKNAVNILHKVRIERNRASHCDPDTEKPLGSRVDAVTKERYEEVKRDLFGSDAMEVMHGLYLLAKKGKN